MSSKRKGAVGDCRQVVLLLITAMLFLSIAVGCGPSTEELEAVDYTPLPGDDWQVSTPAEQGLDPMLVAELYHNAAELETLYGLLVVKDGYLVAEGYFNGWTSRRQVNVQSVSKSYISALVGVALEQGCLSSTDQRMMDFFPRTRRSDHRPAKRGDQDPGPVADACRISLGGERSRAVGGAVGR